MEYFNLIEFESIYLEDSFVLSIVESSGKVDFEMEFALLKGHPKYEIPLEGEQHCYKKGRISFQNFDTLTWEEKQNNYFPPQGDGIDYGNIDFLVFKKGQVELGGDWGHLFLEGNSVKTFCQIEG